MPMLGRLGRNSILALLDAIAAIGVAIVAVPLLVDRVGIVAFGVWSIGQIVITYAASTDAGLAPGVVRFAAVAYGAKDRKELSAIGWTTVFAYGTLALLLAAGGVAFAGPVAGIFNIPDELRADSEAMFRLVAIVAGIQLASGGLNALLHGVGKFGGSLLASVVASASFLVLIVLTVDAGPDALESIAWAYLWGQAFALAVRLILVAPILLAARPTIVRNPLRRRWLVFTARMQLIFVSTIVNNQSDRLIIALVASPTVVGYFAIGSQIAVALRTVAGAALAPMVQAFSEARGARMDVAGRLGPIHASWATVVLAGTAIAVGFSPTGVEAWIGVGSGTAAGFAVILMVSTSINLVTGPATSYLRAIDQPQAEAQYGLVITGLNIALTVPLAFAFGPFGVASGTLVAYGLATVWFFARLRRDEHASSHLWDGFDARREMLIAVVVTAITFGLGELIAEVPSRAGQIVLIVVLAGVAGFVLVVKPLRRAWAEPKVMAASSPDGT